MPDRSAPPRRAGRRRWILSALMLVTLLLAVGALVSQWDGMVRSMRGISWPWVAVAGLLVALAVPVSAVSWSVILRGFGGEIPRTTAVAVFCGGQLGKYVPGGVWAVVAHAEAAKSHGVPRVATGSASLTSMLLTLGTAVPVAIVVLPFAGTAAAVQYWWLGVVLVGCLIVLQPRVIGWGLTIVSRWTGQGVHVTRIDRHSLWVAAGWLLGMWVLFGAHLYVLGLAVGGEGGELLIRSVGGYALAWSVGFIVVFAPAGIGVREAALVIALGSVVPTGSAVAMVVVSRVLVTIADLAWGAWGTAVVLRRGRPAAEVSSP